MNRRFDYVRADVSQEILILLVSFYVLARLYLLIFT